MRQCVVFALLVSSVLSGSAQDQPAKSKKSKTPIPVAGPLSLDLISGLPECSLARVNGDCKFVINRESPMVPATPIQMYSGQRVVVIVRNEKFYERYFLDPVSGQVTQIGDTSAAIVQEMIPALGKLNRDKQVQGLQAQFLGEAQAAQKAPPTTQEMCAAITLNKPPVAADVPDFFLGTKLCLAAL